MKIKNNNEQKKIVNVSDKSEDNLSVSKNLETNICKSEKTSENNNSKTFKKKLDKFFKISERGSSFKSEFFGGLVNFLVLSYIMVVIPGLFANVSFEGMWKALFVATILTTICSTICMALYANLPIILAPGIGVVSYVVQLIESGQYSFAQAMSICFFAGLIFLFLTVTGLRKKIVKAMPNCIKMAIPAGVGLFILNLGLSSSNSGILDMLKGNATSFAPIVAVVSLIIMIILHIKKVKGGIFIGILSGTVLDIILKACTGINPFMALTNNSWLPPFKELSEYTLFNFDFAGLFSGNLFSGILSVALIVFALVLIDMFDTVGTLYATAEKGDLFDENGEVININRAMLIDGCGAIFSSCIGMPTATSYVESSTGIASGAKTGLSAIFTSTFFILALFISPVIMLIPTYATAPALILVGILMFDSVLKIDFKNPEVSIPAILTIIIMPLTSNITYGIAVGLISYTAIMMLIGKFKKINCFTYIIALLFILYFIFLYI